MSKDIIKDYRSLYSHDMFLILFVIVNGDYNDFLDHYNTVAKWMIFFYNFTFLLNIFDFL